MNVIFMGTPDYAKQILEKLLHRDDINIVAVYTQPDKPVGRKKVLTSSPVKVIAEKNALKLFQPEKLRDEDVVAELMKIECDYIVVAAYGQILPKSILEHAPCINLHASILPKYRGASPIQQVLLEGERQTGVTAMLMDVGLDTGGIIKIQTIDIDKDEMVESLFARLTDVAANLTLDVLDNFHTYDIVAQDDKDATHCSKITKVDGEVRFKNALTLYNKYRAFTPWPGIYLQSGLKLKKVVLNEVISHNVEGQILKINSNSIVIGCEIGTIELYSVQAPSKKEVDILSYINGKRLALDDIIS